MARVTRAEDVETKEYVPHQNRYVYRDSWGKLRRVAWDTALHNGIMDYILTAPKVPS